MSINMIEVTTNEAITIQHALELNGHSALAKRFTPAHRLAIQRLFDNESVAKAKVREFGGLETGECFFATSTIKEAEALDGAVIYFYNANDEWIGDMAVTLDVGNLAETVIDYTLYGVVADVCDKILDEV